MCKSTFTTESGDPLISSCPVTTWPGKTCTKTSVESSAVRSSKACTDQLWRETSGEKRCVKLPKTKVPCGFRCLNYKSVSLFLASSILCDGQVALKIQATNGRVLNCHHPLGGGSHFLRICRSHDAMAEDCIPTISSAKKWLSR